MGHADTFLSAEHAHHIVGVGRDFAVDADLPANVHGIFAFVHINRPVGTDGVHLDGEGERLCHAVVVHEIDHLVVGAGVDALVDRERDVLRAERGHVALNRGHGEPVGHTLNGVVTALAALVADSSCELHVFLPFVVELLLDLVVLPFQVVAVHVNPHHHGTGHFVAVEVGHVLHGHVDRSAFNLLVGNVEVHDELVVLGGVAELHVLFQSEVAHRREVLFVGQHGDIADDERVHATGVVAEVVLVALGAKRREVEFIGVVHLLLAAAERQPCHECHFVAVGVHVVDVADHRGRQGGRPQHHVVDVALEAVGHVVGEAALLCFGEGVAGTDVGARRTEAAERVYREGGHQGVVHEDIHEVARTVHGEGVVVPLPVAVIAVDACLSLAGAVNGPAVFETDVELILRVGIGAVRAAVAEECHRVAAGGLEPEGEGVVLRGGTAEIPLVEVDAVGGAVEFRTHALRQRPRGGVEQSRCSLTLVVERGARAFVHRIVVHQSGFVAAEALETHLVQFGRTEHLVPQACFEHIAHIGIAHFLARRVGRAEAQAARLLVVGNGVEVGGERLVALVESEAVRAGIEGGGQLREALEEQLLIGGDDGGVFAQNHGLQAVVAGEAQCEVPVIARVAEEGHVAVRRFGIGQQFDGEVLIGEVALHVGSGVGAAVEVE